MYQGSHHHGKTWKMDEMNSMHGKIMEFDVLKKNLEKSWNFSFESGENPDVCMGVSVQDYS